MVEATKVELTPGKGRWSRSPRGGLIPTFVVRLLLAVLAFAAAVPLSGATLASPLRPRVRPEGAERKGAEPWGERLDLDARALDLLRSARTREPVRLERFPFAPGATGNLLLERFEVSAPDATVRVRGPRGETSRPMPPVAHFSGRLEGEPDSRVYVGVPGGFLVALLQTSAGLVYVGPEGHVLGPVQHVLRRSDSPANSPYAPAGWTCEIEELPLAPTDAPAAPGRRTPSGASPMAASSLKQAAISVETDEELLAKFGGNVDAMAAYVGTLFGQVSVIYERDVAVRLSLNTIQAWTATDPWVATTPRGQLDELGDWWHANRPRALYPRTVVHFLSGKPVSGGVAFVDVLCQADFYRPSGHWGGGYGVTQIYGNYPASLWDAFGTSHELGHNFGSPHTHCFNPPIDRCYSGEAGCYTGSTVNPGPLGGTIMSYCHVLAGGYGNIDMRFHERCVNEEMLPEIDSALCLTEANPPPSTTGFYTVPPCRIADTRDDPGPYGGPAMLAGSDRVWVVAGQCGVPASAKAVALNVTVTDADAAGSLTLYAAGTARPPTTAINYPAARTRANNAIAALGSTGGLAVSCDQASGTAHVVLDVFGYFD